MKIHLPQEEIAAFCRSNFIRQLSLFGSVLRDDFAPDSDIDVLVEFEDGHTPGYDFIRIQDELSQFFEGHPVDLGTRKSLNWRIRDQVLQEALVVYGGKPRSMGAFGSGSHGKLRCNMAKDDTLYLGHMLDMARRAMRLTRGVDREQFMEDETLRLAMAHLVQIIGEAANRVSAETRAGLPQIEWPKIVGARHRIVHDYINVDYGRVWRIVTEELPDLERQLAPLGLGDEPPDEL